MNKSIILNASRTLKISPDVVEKVYKAYWLYIKTTIKDLPLNPLNPASRLKCYLDTICLNFVLLHNSQDYCQRSKNCRHMYV